MLDSKSLDQTELIQMLKYLQINRTFEFPGHIAELMERMNYLEKTTKRFRTTQLSKWNYMISAPFSMGTIHAMGGLGVPINIQMRIVQSDMSSPKVYVTSNIRVEHYFLIVLFTIMFLITLFNNEPWYLSLLPIGLFFVSHYWFHMVYRVQENELINKVKGQLRLKEQKNGI